MSREVNPILRAERRIQRRKSTQRRITRIWWVIFGAGILISVLLYGFALSDAINGQISYSTITYFGDYLPSGFAAATIGLYVYVIIRTLYIGSTRIAREKQSGRWEILILTNQSARSIVRAKWWSVLEAVGSPVIILTSLKFGLVVLLGTSLSWFNVLVPWAYFTWEPPSLLGLMLWLLVIPVLTWLGVAFAAAVAVAVSAAAPRPAHAIIASIVTYLLVAILPALALSALLRTLLEVPAPDAVKLPDELWVRVLGATVSSLRYLFFDHGSLVATQLAYPSYVAEFPLQQISPIMVLISAVLLWFGTQVFLRIGIYFAVASGALAHKQKEAM